MFHLLPETIVNDPAQVTDKLNEAVNLAEKFVAAYHKDCPRVAIIEFKVVGWVEYQPPKFVEA